MSFAALLPDRSSATVTYEDGRAERLQPTADGMVSATLRGAESVAIMSPTATRIVRIPDPMAKMTYGALPRGWWTDDEPSGAGTPNLRGVSKHMKEGPPLQSNVAAASPSSHWSACDQRATTPT